MAMQFAPDGRMFFNEVSKGAVRILGRTAHSRKSRSFSCAWLGAPRWARSGWRSIPDFATNHWVYVFYSQARNDNGDPEDNRIVRYTERDGWRPTGRSSSRTCRRGSAAITAGGSGSGETASCT